MPSSALLGWETTRSKALDRLERVHTRSTGAVRGRPQEMVEFNHALFLRLAAEIQGFCRDLHDEAATALSVSGQGGPELSQVLRNAMVTSRKLDWGNASPGNIGSDWARLGLPVWLRLHDRYPGPRGAAKWNESLEWLNDARNGIVHSDQGKVAKAHAKYPLTLNTFRAKRRTLERFGRALDLTVGAYLQQLTGGQPW